MRGTSAGSGQGSPGRGRGETMKPASRRLSVRGFLPLPPIMASPVGSPSASLSSTSSVYVVVSTPTWISTPPTPTKLTRHSSACRPRRTASATPLSPSASFSASMHTHAMPRQTPRLKKCISVPNILGRARTLSGPHRLEGNPPVPSSLPSDQHLDIVVSHMEGDGRRTRDKAIFHLSSSNTDTEDEVFHSAESRPQSSGRENSPDGSWSDHSPEGIWEQERVKDALRRFHALKELLSTEAGYLTHLKAFVVVCSFVITPFRFRARIPTGLSSQLANSRHQPDPYILHLWAGISIVHLCAMGLILRTAPPRLSPYFCDYGWFRRHTSSLEYQGGSKT